MLGPLALLSLALHAAPRPISVADAMRSATLHQPQVLVAKANLAQTAGRVDQLAGDFVPALTYRATGGAARALSGTTGGAPEQRVVGTAEASLAVVGKTRFGLRYSAGVQVQHEALESFSNLTGPALQVFPNVQLRQPLLRGRGTEAVLGPLRDAELAERAAQSALVRTELDVAAAAADRYWDWTFDRAGVGIAEASLQQARGALAMTREKAKAGAISPLEVAQAEATVAARQSELLVARRQVLASEDALLRASYLQVGTVRLAEAIAPADLPARTFPEVSLDDALAVALRNRPELPLAEAEIEGQEAIVATARNALEARLDAVATAGYGFGNQEAALGLPVGFTNPVASVLPSGPLVTVGVEGDLPFSRKGPRGELEQAIAELDRRKAALYAAREAIALDVRNAVQQLELDRDRLARANEAERLAGVNLDAEQKKFQGGLSTTYDVLRVQAELARSRSDSARALASLNQAWAELEKAEGVLLADHGLSTP